MGSGALANQFIYVASLACAPQSLQVIKLSGPCRENVDHEIDVIHQDPFAFLVAFNVQRAYSEFAKSFFNAFPNRLIVAARSAGTDDEVIGEGTDVAEFDHNNVLRLLVEGGFKSFRQLVVLRFLVNGILL